MTRDLLVTGPPLAAIDEALGVLLSGKPRDEPVVVLDYLGRAASALGPANAGHLSRDAVAWLDLADRRKPCTVFRLRRSGAFTGILRHLLQEMAAILEVPLESAAIEQACRQAWDLADGARLTLSSLLRCFGTREGNALGRWFDHEAMPLASETALARTLATALRYPAVWALSEEGSGVDLAGPLGDCATVWLELPLERFEPVEHRFVALLAEVAVMEGLAQRTGEGPRHVTVLHAFPATAPCLLLLRTEAHRGRQGPATRQLSAALGGLIEQARRPHLDLYERLCREETLRAGWFRVARGSRAAGTDGISVALFRGALDAELGRLADELSGFRYRCRPLRRQEIPKPDGGTRALGIACVRDRVVQAACLSLLEEVLEPQFSGRSFAYRPNRNAHDALATARGLIASGLSWAVIADIQRCLDPLDRHLERNGFSFVRYADDTVVFTRTETEARQALGSMAAFLQDPLRLSLRPSKTDVVPVAEGVPFLGFLLKDFEVGIDPSRLSRATSRVSLHLRTLAARETGLLDRGRALERLNAFVRGFRTYFQAPGEPFVAAQLRILDAKVAAEAEALLPAAVLGDPEWIRRERFAPTPEEAPDVPFSTVGEYPQEPSARLPPLPASPRAEPPGTRRADRRDDPGEAAEDDGETAGEGAAAGAFVISGRLHVLAHGSFVLASDDHVIVRKRGRELVRVPFSQLHLVHVQGHGIGLSAAALVRAAGFDLPVVLSPLVGAPAAVVNPVKTSRSDLRAQQVLRRDDPDVLRAGVAMLAAKMANQAADYTYGILYGEVWRALVHAGLDPYFGILHGSSVNQGGLVFDLIEEFRPPFADRVVLGMLGRGLVLEHGKEGFLSTRVRHRLAAGFGKTWHRKIRFRGHLRAPEEILQRNAADLVRLFRKGDAYRAYRMKW